MQRSKACKMPMPYSSSLLRYILRVFIAHMDEESVIWLRRYMFKVTLQ